jgi:ribosomal protein S18 acetylase RimI-like enzyme
VENRPARRLFEAAGFRVLQREEQAYPRGQDALRMIRPVDTRS